MKKANRYIAIIMIYVLMLSTVLGCGKSTTTTDDGKIYLTRAGWIKMLCETMNLDTYEQETSYYNDVDKDSEIFSYVQAAREWGVLSDADSFKPNDIATFGFMATTAVLASEGDYAEFDAGNENDAIIAFAKLTNILAIDFDERNLTQGITSQDAENALCATQKVYLELEKEEVENIQLDKDVVDLRNKPSGVTSANESDYTISADIASGLHNGTVFIAPGDDESPYGIARKVESIIDNGNGTYSLATSQPEIEEVYQEFEYYGKVVPSAENVKVSDGVILSYAEDDNKAYTNSVNNSNKASFIGTTNNSVNKTVADRNTTSKFVFEVNFTNGKVSVDNGFQKLENDYLLYLAGNSTGVDKDNLGKFFEKTSFIPSQQMKKAEKELDDNMNLYKEGEISLGELQQRCNLTNKGTEKIAAENHFSGGYEITGKVTLEDFYITPDISFKKAFGVPYSIKSLSVGVGSSITSELNIKGNLKDELTIASIDIPVGTSGFNVKVAIKLVAELDGSIAAKLEVENTQKFSYEDGKFKATNTKSSSVSGELAIELSAGARLSVVLDYMKVKLGDVSVDCKFVTKASGEVKDTVSTEVNKAENTVTVTRTGELIPNVEMFFPVIDLKIGYDKSTLMGKMNMATTFHLVKEGDGWSKTFADDKDKRVIYILSRTEPLVEEKETQTNKATEGNTDSKTGTNITLDISDYYASIKNGESKTITVDSIPSGYSKDQLKWSTSDLKVADVNNGTIKSNGVGTCTISVATADGKYKCQCTVVVTE
ncbi:MAG: Ig-like domain-containing protein [Eubacteriales bacterium]|nr:Ig-like domain-containing protein [Eubacteriales bacterium]